MVRRVYSVRPSSPGLDVSLGVGWLVVGELRTLGCEVD